MSNKNDKEKTSNKNFLVIYGIIVVILLVLIVFIIPDDIFMLKYKNVELPSYENTEEKREFVDYLEQQKRLSNNDYDYSYLVLDSMGSKTYQYSCEGKIANGLEIGTCSEPEIFSYNNENKGDLFKISIKYLSFANVMELIRDVEPEIVLYYEMREYHYSGVLIEDLKTEVVVYTDIDNITKIEISNKYMTYILKYSNISS